MTLIRDVAELSLPLCPNVATGITVDPLHAVATTVLDAFHKAADKDADGEFTSPEVAKAYRAAADRVTDRMRLYRTTVSYPAGGRFQVVVSAYYFRCGVCGFTLPATGEVTTT
jgi:hypothetical protein